MIRTITLTPSLMLLAALAGFQTVVAQEKPSTPKQVLRVRSKSSQARFERG